MNARIKELRLSLKLSQEDFGNAIGVTRSAVSKLESNNRGVTEQMIKSICREFNVNENWLRTGEGEMFLELSKAEMASSIVGKLLYQDDEFIQNVFIALGQMSSEEWKVIKGIVEKIKNS